MDKRIAYASEAARAKWAPVLASSERAATDLELLTITDGIRDAALVTTGSADAPLVTAACVRRGLEVTALAASAGQTVVAIHRHGQASAWVERWAAQDHEAIGVALGYPGCCAAWFAELSGAGAPGLMLASSPETVAPAYQSPLLSVGLVGVGVRVVPHFPCSPTCAGSLALAQDVLACAHRVGLADGARDSVAALELRCEWVALHGVAEVTTPFFRFHYPTDYTAARVSVVYGGR